MIDSLAALALALKSSPGVYAVLVGSGVSRSAAIPTGWDIVKELIERVAQMQREHTSGDPVGWYVERFKHEPNYSELLERLAPSAPARRDILRGFFEPSAEHRERNERIPTEAHHAIAGLVASGHIRVIVTTNFDRLMEQALEGTNVHPTVVSSTDGIRGMAPLAHSTCTVIKVHGDYLDMRLRNTPEELANYDPEMSGLLERVFDEYGLIVCGWSADYDSALRALVEGTRNRRYPMFWTGVHEVSPDAEKLIGVRSARFIRIESADKFFSRLREMVEVLETIERHHPLTLPAVVGLLKRHIERGETIRKHDLINDVGDPVIARLGKADVHGESTTLDSPAIERRVRRYEALAEVVVGAMRSGAFWEPDDDVAPYARLLSRMTTVAEAMTGYSAHVNLRLYPALLSFYAAGISATIAQKYQSLKRLAWQGALRFGAPQHTSIWNFLYTTNVMQDDVGRLLPGQAGTRTPVNNWLYETLKPHLAEYVTDEQEYDAAFARFEYIMALVHACNGPSAITMGPLGRFHWQQKHDEAGGVLALLRAEMQSEADRWAPFAAGLFRVGYVDLRTRINAFEQFRTTVKWV